VESTQKSRVQEDKANGETWIDEGDEGGEACLVPCILLVSLITLFTEYAMNTSLT
jgi:hypothetical protein